MFLAENIKRRIMRTTDDSTQYGKWKKIIPCEMIFKMRNIDDVDVVRMIETKYMYGQRERERRRISCEMMHECRANEEEEGHDLATIDLLSPLQKSSHSEVFVLELISVVCRNLSSININIRVSKQNQATSNREKKGSELISRTTYFLREANLLS